MKRDTYSTEEHSRSVIRSVIWRIMGVIVLALITYLVTRSILITTILTVVYHGLCVLVYYMHERLWLKIDQYWKTKYRVVFRLIIYELIFGVGALGILSWLITGQIKQATTVTIIYISNKLWMYVAYDWFWNRFSWRKKIVEVAK